MKNLLLLIIILIPGYLFSQLATSEPSLPLDSDEVTIIFDLSLGSGNLIGYEGDVYVHTGVLTDKSTASGDWKYVQSSWGENTPETKLTRIGQDKYEIIISPSIREYYSVPDEEIITNMAFVLRSDVEVNGSFLEGKEQEGKDIFVEVFEAGLQISILNPTKNVLTSKNTDIAFEAKSTEIADINLYQNGEIVKSLNGNSVKHVFNYSISGDYWIKVEANNGDETVADSVFIHILANEVTESLPDGMKEGFNETGSTSGILVLYAPGKEHVFILGDFNYFTPSGKYRMKNDGNYFWLELTNLSPGEEYAYQYLVDGNLKIADPYTEKVLDPWNDKWIPDSTYPNLKEFPYQYTDGICSILQTDKPEYQWSGKEYHTPDEENLVIYELLVRDFIANHDWKTLKDTLNYFTDLGINAIEVMPFNEFEGNESWGYNPSFYFAPDKYYGPANDLKEFVDSCHNRGIAVIMDVVYNHSFGQSPLVQMYWNDTLNRPSADNPWYNETSPNTAYSWGYDFNHESPDTKKFIDRANKYWLTEYKLDGFRFDFTKGFTNTPGDGGAYDPARISILKRMTDAIKSVKSDAYVILEHFADNSEEKVLSDYGMMIWGNQNYNYNEATMGWNENGKSDFSWISYKNRTWNDPHLVGYMESHDEERLMFKNLNWGNEYWEYDIKDLKVALARIELAASFFIPIPGPKMIWQFGEMGYDYSIDFNGRVGNKPIRWDYYNSRDRLREVYSKLIYLKLHEPAFTTNDFNISAHEATKRIELNHPDMDVRIIGNFDVKSLPVSASFSHTGIWYEYFSGEELSVDDVNKEYWLKGGEYRIYTSKKLETPDLPTKTEKFVAKDENFSFSPNPVSDKLFIQGKEKASEIKILDISGRVLSSEQINKSTFSLNFSQFENGLYFVSVLDEHKRIQTSAVIKN